MAEPAKKKKKVRLALTEEQRKRKRQTDRVRNQNKINIGAALSEWRELRQKEGCKSDADLALLLLHLFAAPPPAADDIIVNIKCLLQLFHRCEQCWSESVNQVIRDRTYLSVVQRCHSCQHIRKWASNPSAAQPMHSGNGEKSQNAKVAKKQPDEAIGLTGSLAMEVTEDQPPRLGGSGPSLVRRKKGNKGTQRQKELTEGVWDSKTDSVQSQDDSYFISLDNTGGEGNKVKSLVGEQPETIVDQHASIEVTIDSIDAEDSESQTSEADTEGEKLVADGGCEREDSVNEAGVDLVEGVEDEVEKEMVGEEEERDEKVGEEKVGEVKEEKVGEVKEEKVEEQTGLRESDSDFHREDEAEDEGTASDSDFDPEEGRATTDNGRGSGRGRGRAASQGSGREWKLLQKPTAETSVNMSAYISVSASKQRKSNRPKDEMVLCPECGILYSTRLQEYRKCEHKYTVQCLDCGKYFVNIQGLKLHQRRLHWQGYEFPCKYCLRPFTTRPIKLIHERTHTFTENVPAYSCSECPMGFHDIILRNRHLKQHKSKRHICRTCCKEFDKGHLLTRHELCHSADKPFKCQVCQRAFAQFSQLKSHLRVHTGERPFQCQLCDKSFNHNVSLKNHVRRYHSPAYGADPDGDKGARAAEQGECSETNRATGKDEGQAERKKRPQQVQLTFWTEWGEADGEEKKRKRKRQCFDDDDDGDGLGEAAKRREEEEEM
ncbi:hypothetical protein UPYG_G00156430 [Umbra pygmaea]|uniref:C2H2-type domain-containing protein n=1 Tax=Umbra pygmaea TaxID=75934 RepID=A0ABD0XGD8_UMBPY